MNKSRRQLEQLGEPFGESCTRMELGHRRIYGGGGSGGGSSTSTQINYSPEEAARRTQVMDESQRIYNQTTRQPVLDAAGKPTYAPKVAAVDPTYDEAGNKLTEGTAASGGEQIFTGKEMEYPGAKPIGPDAMTTAGQNAMIGGAQQVAGAIDTAQNASGYAQNAINQQGQMSNFQNMMMAGGMNYGLNGAMDVQNNPYLQQAMGAAIRPLTQAWEGAGGTLSQARTAEQQAGQYGGTRGGIAEGITNRAYLDKVGDVTAQMGNAAYDRGQQTFASSLAQMPAWQKSATGNAELSSEYMKNAQAGLTPITNASQAPGSMISAVGAQRENYAQSAEDYAANQRMFQINAPWIPLQNYASIVYGGSAPSTQTQSSSSAPRTGLSQVVGAGLTGASMYNMMNA